MNVPVHQLAGPMLSLNIPRNQSRFNPALAVAAAVTDAWPTHAVSRADVRHLVVVDQAATPFPPCIAGRPPLSRPGMCIDGAALLPSTLNGSLALPPSPAPNPTEAQLTTLAVCVRLRSLLLV